MIIASSPGVRHRINRRDLYRQINLHEEERRLYDALFLWLGIEQNFFQHSLGTIAKSLGTLYGDQIEYSINCCQFTFNSSASGRKRPKLR